MSKLVAEHEYTRAEFDWIAVDESGNVGFFASGGFGPVPQVSLAAADELLSVQERIRALPWTCKTNCVAQVEYYLGDFFEVAEKGVFAYNWDFDRREYRLIVKPVRLWIRRAPDRSPPWRNACDCRYVSVLPSGFRPTLRFRKVDEPHPQGPTGGAAFNTYSSSCIRSLAFSIALCKTTFLSASR